MRFLSSFIIHICARIASWCSFESSGDDEWKLSRVGVWWWICCHQAEPLRFSRIFSCVFAHPQSEIYMREHQLLSLRNNISFFIDANSYYIRRPERVWATPQERERRLERVGWENRQMRNVWRRRGGKFKSDVTLRRLRAPFFDKKRFKLSSTHVTSTRRRR